jgi:hypothetical protein
MPRPRLCYPLLRIVPDAYERDFWHRSLHFRRLAAALDWWSLWLCCQTGVWAVRFFRTTAAAMVEEDYYKLYSCVCIVFGLAQAAWRRLAPNHYFRMRVWVVLFNR